MSPADAPVMVDGKKDSSGGKKGISTTEKPKEEDKPGNNFSTRVNGENITHMTC